MSAAPTIAPRRSPSAEAGLVGSAVSLDHKRIGMRTAATALAFFLVGGVFALVIRGELAAPGMQIVGKDAYNQLFTLHGSVMVHLVVVPAALALGLYLVPLQIGASAIAAPRAALIGSWLIPFGGVTMLLGFLSGQGAAKAGWTAYFPLSGSSASPGSGTDLWIAGVIAAAAGSLLIAVSLLGTILRRRAPGMTMLRIPVFTWTMVVTTLMVILAVPALLVGMGLLIAARHLGGIFDGANGPIIYQNLFWFWGHPIVYVMFFPFLGIVAEVVATFSGRRFFGYRAMVLALLAFTGLSMSVWAHHMFTTGQVQNEYFALTSTLLIVPAGIEYFDVIGTMRGGRIRLLTPMLFALGFLGQFLIGGLSGIFVAAPTLDYQVHDSYFVVAHFHYTLFAGSLFGLFAGVYYWFPKLTGRLLGEGLGKLHFWLLVVGANLTFFPMFLLGERGMPRRVADYASSDGFTFLNDLATAGAAVIAVATVVFLWNLLRTIRHGEPAGDDPWEGGTLEWATSSPPPPQNFTALPEIRSHAPLLDLRLERSRGSETAVAAADGMA